MNSSTKDTYVEKQKAQIDKWQTEIEDLEKKAATASADAKAKLEHKEQVAALRNERNAARAKLTEIEAADNDNWEGLKDGLENIWTNIRSGIDKIKAKF